MSVAGNIEAIRDWGNRFFYTKGDVTNFFLKNNSGLTAYRITILSSKNSTVNIVEDVVSDPQIYSVKTNTSGTYTGLFFFTAGSDVIFTCGSKTATITLTDSIMTVNVNEYIISDLIPQQNSNQNISYYNFGGTAYWIFDKSENDRQSYGSSDMTGAYITYNFSEPQIVLRFKLAWKLYQYKYIDNFKFIIRGYVNEEWIDLTDVITVIVENNTDMHYCEQTIEYPLDEPIEITKIKFELRSHPGPAGNANNNNGISFAELYYYGYTPD